MSETYHFSQEQERQKEFALLKLPAASMVIDVRQQEERGDLLLDYLVCMFDDLVQELTSQQIARWRRLSSCIEFVRVNVLDPLDEQLADTTFELTSARWHESTQVKGGEGLAQLIGNRYIDQLRKARMHALRDYDFDTVTNPDPELFTVRVFFLVDLGEEASVNRAATYAAWLKRWSKSKHGAGQFLRGPFIEVIAVGLNASATAYHRTVLPVFQIYPDTVDLMIVLQEYAEGAIYLGEQVQFLVELILYVLLLNWPQAFERVSAESTGIQFDALSGIMLTPCPTYTIGIAALEHSVRRATRWLDYSLADHYLACLIEEEKESTYDKDAAFKWLGQWWQEVAETVPTLLAEISDDFLVFARIRQQLKIPQSKVRSLREEQQRFRTMRQQIHDSYTSSSATTLLHALRQTPGQMAHLPLDHHHMPTTPEKQGNEDAMLKQAHRQLGRLYTLAEQFPTSIASGVQGSLASLPYVQKQVRLLQSAISETLPEISEAMLPKLQREFDHEAEQVATTRAMRAQFWKLPLLGSFFPLTFLLWILALFLCGVLTWLPITIPEIGGIWLVKGMLMLAIFAITTLLVSQHSRQMLAEYNGNYQHLTKIVHTHLKTVERVISAQIARTLLQQADLYTPDVTMCPYEKTLHASTQILRTLQHRTHSQRQLTETYWQTLETKEDIASRHEILDWTQVKQQCHQLIHTMQTETHAFRTLTQVLLQSLNKKGIAGLLDTTMAHMPPVALRQTDEVKQIQEVLSICAAMLLTAQVKPLDPFIQPRLQRLIAQRKSVLQDQFANVKEMQTAISEVINEKSVQIVSFPDATHLDMLHHCLLNWVAYQRSIDPQLVEILTSERLPAFFKHNGLSLKRLVDRLAHQAILLGQMDTTPTDNDTFYLLLAPGEVYRALENNDSTWINTAKLQFFPDEERVIYMRIHRIRHISPEDG